MKENCLPRAVMATAEAEADVTFREGEWSDALADLLAFDRLVHAAEDAHPNRPITFYVAANHAVSPVQEQVTTRYQRLFLRPSAQAESPDFGKALACFCALHDRSKPLVRADFDHALDVWQWLLRIHPGACVVLQIAALFHDIERLETEADARVEQHAPDYIAFKVAHARRGSERVRRLLSGCGVDPGIVERASQLVATHERPGSDEELAALNDADALSFFSLNCAGFIQYFGWDHTRKKVEYTLNRMRPSARSLLAGVRLPAAIHGLVFQA